MAEGRRGLGRGLSALLDEARSAATPEGRGASGARELPIELVHRNPDQPRRAFAPEELDELAASIRARGVIQPIIVRPLGEPAGEYQIVAGERRWRAAQLAGLRGIPALVRALDDQEVMEIALIENVQRADLNAIEEAGAYVALSKRFGRSAEAVARIVGKSRSHVANTMRLMRLPEPIREHLETGRLTAGHARALLDVEGATELAAQVVKRGLNVRQTEALARRARQPGARLSRTLPPTSADARDLERNLGNALGLDVEIRHAGDKGELRIAYRSLEQLDDLCVRLMRAGPGR